MRSLVPLTFLTLSRAQEDKPLVSPVCSLISLTSTSINNNPGSVTINDEYTIGASAMTCTPSMNVTAGMIHALHGGCESGGYPDDMAGKIVLVQRGWRG